MTVRPAFPDEEIDEIIANVYAAYRGVQLTLIAEAYAIRHSAATIAGCRATRRTIHSG